MNDRVKVSVIVPIYNAERHLRQCLDSLLNQGVETDCYEIICVNDGSRDASFSIIEEYAAKHPCIVAVQKENEGVSAARNSGLAMARGDYVWFVDADDWIAKDFLGQSGITQQSDENNTHLALLLTQCVDVRDSEAEQYNDYRVSADELTFETASPFMTTARGHFFDRALIEKGHLRFDTNLSYGEDLIFMRDFLDLVRFENEQGNRYSIQQCNGKGVYLYRIHDASAMGQLHSHIEKVADSILYRARLSLERYRAENKPDWYRANYQEYVNLHMQEYMIYYFPALNTSMRAHLRELKKE